MCICIDVPESYEQGAEEALRQSGTLDSVLFTPNGPAGVFALYVAPGTNLGQVFLNEFVCVRVFHVPQRPVTDAIGALCRTS